MPGFIIHIAVGKEYIKKHENEIKDVDEFIKGIVAQDLSSILNLVKLLELLEEQEVQNRHLFN